MANANVRKRVSGFVVHIDLKHLLDKSVSECFCILHRIKFQISNIPKTKFNTHQSKLTNKLYGFVFVAFDSIEFRYIWNSKLVVYPKIVSSADEMIVLLRYDVLCRVAKRTRERAHTHTNFGWVKMNSLRECFHK